MLQTRKYGKYVLIGSEDVEVFPVHCADGHHCVQCWFEGKTYCAPRFWGYSKPELNRWKYQKPRKGGYTSLVSLEALMRLPRYTGGFAAQPLVPIPDGGFTEEITDRLIERSKPYRSVPPRLIDIPCPKCGYVMSQYSDGTRTSGTGIGIGARDAVKCT